jgi:capsular polysaccharide biosynthesis protein
MSRLPVLRRPRVVAGLVVAVLTVLGVGAGWALERARGEEWQAATDVLVRFWSVEGYLLTGQSSPVSAQDVADAATLARSSDVLDRAARLLDDGRSGADLRGAVTVVPQSTAHAVSITATADSATTARRTSEAVATATVDALGDRVQSAADGLSHVAPGDFLVLLEQRAQVLTRSVQPLVPLATSAAEPTSTPVRTMATFGVVGLAAGTLLVVAVRFTRPVVREARDAQRLTERPAVPFGGDGGHPEAARLLRRLLDDRPDGAVVVVPVDAAAEKPAQAFVDWARTRSSGPAEAARLVAGPDPVGVALHPRRAPREVAAVLLVVPEGTRRRALADAVAVLPPAWAADAVVVTR